LSTHQLYDVLGLYADEVLARSMDALERDAREESQWSMRAGVDLVHARKYVRELLKLEAEVAARAEFDASDYERPPKSPGRVPAASLANGGDEKHVGVPLPASTTTRTGGVS
jgi:hypothetical protein